MELYKYKILLNLNLDESRLTESDLISIISNGIDLEMKNRYRNQYGEHLNYNLTVIKDSSKLNTVNVTEHEQTLIKDALYITNGNRVEAAKLLGMSSRTLFRKIKLYNIDIPGSRPYYSK